MTNKFSDEEKLKLTNTIFEIINMYGSLPDLRSRVTVMLDVLCFFIVADSKDKKSMDLLMNQIINTLPSILKNTLKRVGKRDEVDEKK